MIAKRSRWLVPLVGMAGAAAWLYTRPLNVLHPPTLPAADHRTAQARLEALLAREAGQEGLNPVCRTTLLSHGPDADHVVVLWHGLTNCPAQFRLLGERLHGLGCNVLIPRFPTHGLADRLTAAPAAVEAEDWLRAAIESLDIAQGLGRRVSVMGLSAGGVMAAWAAQFRHDVERAVLLSPALGHAALPAWLTRPAVVAMLALPNRFLWWDPRLKDAGSHQTHAYPRFSTHAAAEVLRLGWQVYVAAERNPPLCRQIVFVRNPADRVVNQDLAWRLAARWRHAGATVTEVALPGSLALDHDFVDPTHPRANVDAVYPLLEEALLSARPGSAAD